MESISRNPISPLFNCTLSTPTIQRKKTTGLLCTYISWAFMCLSPASILSYSTFTECLFLTLGQLILNFKLLHHKTALSILKIVQIWSMITNGKYFKKSNFSPFQLYIIYTNNSEKKDHWTFMYLYLLGFYVLISCQHLILLYLH